MWWLWCLKLCSLFASIWQLDLCTFHPWRKESSICRNKMYNLQFYSLTVTEPLNISINERVNIHVKCGADGWVELKGYVCTYAAKMANTQEGAISTNWQFVIRNNKTWYYDHLSLFKLLVKLEWRKYQHCAFKSISLEIDFFSFLLK